MKSPSCSVQVIQSTFWQTNTGIITDPNGQIVLVDPGVLPVELERLARMTGKGRLIAALATHEDWDHVLWSPILGSGIPRLAHPRTIQILTEQRDTLLTRLSEAERELGVSWDHDLAGRLEPAPDGTLSLGQHIQVTIVPTPGHTAGHTSLWLERDGILFAGDMLSDVDPPILADTARSADDYISSLDALAPLVGMAATIIPGHGTQCDGDEATRRLERDRHYLDVVRDAADRGASAPVEEIARDTAHRLADPRIHWTEGWRAHVMNIETMRGTM
jgi:glyoxylase-like metal-dependent hydrolase (beta-lactamase superfamily II)